MQKRDFLRVAAAGALSTLAPGVMAQPAKPAAKKLIPTIAHNLIGVDSTGAKIDLDDLAGKVCLISFFTFDCSSCMEDLRLMREFYVGNKQKNFSMIGVNTERHKKDYLELMGLLNKTIPESNRFPIVWRNAPEHHDTFGPLKTNPTHFVINKAHKQVLRRDGLFRAEDWDDLWTSLG